MSTNTVGHRMKPSLQTGLTALGTAQATAYPLVNNTRHEFTTVGSSTGAVLPSAVIPSEVSVYNDGANSLAVYPPPGGTINGGTVNASVALTAGSGATYWASSSTNWYSAQSQPSTSGSGTVSSGTSGQIAVYTATGTTVSGVSPTTLNTITEVAQTSGFIATAGSFYAISGSSNLTATLPTAIGNAGQVVRIRCVSGYTGLCKIATTGGQTVGPGSATSQIIYAGESALLQSDGSNWVRTGGTIIPAACRIYLGTITQSIPNAVFTKILFDTTTFDSTGQMAVTSSNEVKIIRPGRYRVTAEAFFVNASTQQYLFLLNPNKNGSGTTLLWEGVQNPTSTANLTVAVTGIQVFAAGDLLTVNVYQGNAAATALSLTNGDTTSLEVEEIPSW